jgi:hypothetical protein
MAENVTLAAALCCCNYSSIIVLLRPEIFKQFVGTACAARTLVSVQILEGMLAFTLNNNSNGICPIEHLEISEITVSCRMSPTYCSDTDLVVLFASSNNGTINSRQLLLNTNINTVLSLKRNDQ